MGQLNLITDDLEGPSNEEIAQTELAAQSEAESVPVNDDGSSQGGASAPESDPPASTELPSEPSAELLAAQTETSRLTQALAEAEQRASARDLETESRDLADLHARSLQGLIESGVYSEETAKEITETKRLLWVTQQHLAISQSENAALRISTEDSILSEKYGVPEVLLKVFTTSAQKEAYAKAAGTVERGRKDLNQQARNAAVPAQQFSKQASGRSAGSGAYAQRLKSGESLPSSADIDRITAKYAQ